MTRGREPPENDNDHKKKSIQGGIMPMDNLVIIKADEVYTTSEIIAKGAKVNYRSVQRLIEKYESDLLEFGKVRFQITPSIEGKRGQNKKLYYLNEEQVTLLMTYLKNTEVVRHFKKELVRQFFAMRKFIMERQSVQWQTARQQSKLTRAAETDTLQKLVEYAKRQGSKNADKLYMVYTKLVNRTLGIERRDAATVQQLNLLSLLENILLHVIEDGMRQELPYKQIYTLCKEHMSRFASMAYLSDIRTKEKACIPVAAGTHALNYVTA